MSRRKCTNVLYIFVIVLCYVFMFTLFAAAPGPSDEVKKYRTIPMDSNGNFCGEGILEDYPKLYFFNMEKPLDSVCVKECPQFDYNKLRGKDTEEKMGYSQFKKLKNRFFSFNELSTASTFQTPSSNFNLFR